MKKIFSILVFSILIFNAGCESLFFYPQKELLDNPSLEGISYEDIYLTTPDGLKLHAWFLRAKKESKGTILYLHGNAENISTHINNVLWLVPEGYDIFALSYRGYGQSEGYPTIKGVNLDARAAIEKVFTMWQTNKGRVFILGQSLGGAIAVYTVANSPYKERIKALIIDSAFAGYRLIAREKLADFIITWPFQYPLSLLFNDDYSPIRWIKEISPVPVLIIHGEKDRVVPAHHGSILYGEALQPKEFWLVNDADHIEALAMQEIRERLLKYLDGVQ